MKIPKKVPQPNAVGVGVKEYTEEILNASERLPHCDMFVLHRPGTCDYCDKVPELQRYRIKYGINFTNESDPELADCPSWEARPVERIERWGGNVPHVDVRPRCICYPGMCPWECEPACPAC